MTNTMKPADDEVKRVLADGADRLAALCLVKSEEYADAIAFIGDQTFDTFRVLPVDVRIPLMDLSAIDIAITVPIGVLREKDDRYLLWITEMTPKKDQFGVLHAPKFGWHWHSDADESCHVKEGLIFGYYSRTPLDRNTWQEYYVQEGGTIEFPAGVWHSVNCGLSKPTLLEVEFNKVN